MTLVDLLIWCHLLQHGFLCAGSSHLVNDHHLMVSTVVVVIYMIVIMFFYYFRIMGLWCIVIVVVNV